ncbi:MAG: DUF1127 domain-containing protein [Yoonia sp.]
MAAFDTTRPTAVLSAGRITNLVTSTFGNIATWNDARNTRKTLSKLTARELEDIGLCYGDIEKIAARKTF